MSEVLNVAGIEEKMDALRLAITEGPDTPSGEVVANWLVDLLEVVSDLNARTAGRTGRPWKASLNSAMNAATAINAGTVTVRTEDLSDALNELSLQIMLREEADETAKGLQKQNKALGDACGEASTDISRVLGEGIPEGLAGRLRDIIDILEAAAGQVEGDE